MAIDEWSHGQGKSQHFAVSFLRRIEPEVAVQDLYEGEGILTKGDHKWLDVLHLLFEFAVERVRIDEEIPHLWA